MTVTDDDVLDMHASAVTMQASELAAAYRHWAAHGRRPATRTGLEGKVASLLFTTAIFAAMASIDIESAIGRRLA